MKGIPNSLSRGRVQGFTFVEILAAMIFMAIVIPTAIEGLIAANRAGVIAERKRIATMLAEQEISGIITEGSWQSGDLQGDFGADYSGYRWEMRMEDWNVDNMGLVTVSVWYKVQERDYSVQLSTLVDKETITTNSNTMGMTAL